MRSIFLQFLTCLLLLSATVAASSSGGAATFRPRSALTTPRSVKSSAVLNTEVVNPTISHGISASGGASANPGGLLQALAGAAVFAAIEKAVKMGLKAANIVYPAQLGACIVLFATMSVTDIVAPVTANRIFTSLTPGAALLAKWFPVFFVPGLAMLPLSPPIGGTMDVSTVESDGFSCYLGRIRL